jgi:hypothetical protein
MRDSWAIAQPTTVVYKPNEDPFGGAARVSQELLPLGICFDSMGMPVDVSALNMATLTMRVTSRDAALQAKICGYLGATLLFV